MTDMRSFVLLLGALAWLHAGIAIASPEEDFEQGMKEYHAGQLTQSMETLGRAAEAGYAPAQAFLGYVQEKSGAMERSAELYLRAAEQGNADGAWGLGLLYATGRGVERDEEKAREWIQRAAEQGKADAMIYLADAYLKGSLGLEQDEQEAKRWLGIAAEAGDTRAQKQLEALGGSPSSASSTKE